MIEIDGLTKQYGDKTAVDRLSFVVEPGVVAGFLGPNGAGKSTTIRMIAGLDRPTTGTVRVNGKHYPGAAAPNSELGILLDPRSVHPGLSAPTHPAPAFRVRCNHVTRWRVSLPRGGGHGRPTA
jgi:ABC-2 type transport system ATP-binding protein